MLSGLPLMRLRVSVSLGTILWLVLGLERGLVEKATITSLLDSTLLLASLITVPLQLALLEPRMTPRAEAVLEWARLLQPLAGMLLAIAMAVPAGTVSGALAVPWLLCALIAGAAGAVHMFSGRRLGFGVLLPAAALVYFAAGAAWAVAYRADVQAFGSSPVLVELTAIHLHFAGLGATVLGLLTRERCGPRRQGLATAGAAALIIGTPVVLAGRTALGHAPAPASALLAGGGAIQAMGVVIIAGLAATEVARLVPGLARLLLAAAAAGVLISMALALISAAAPLLGSPAPGTTTLAETHGVINAFLFVLISTLAWTVIEATGA